MKTGAVLKDRNLAEQPQTPCGSFAGIRYALSCTVTYGLQRASCGYGLVSFIVLVPLLLPVCETFDHLEFECGISFDF